MQSLMQPNNQMILYVKCFDDEAQLHLDNKLFEVPADIRYIELQEIVNKKYNNSPMLIQYIDEANDKVTIDSDLVLQRAI